MFNWLKKYFVPHASNEYKPHFLRHESITLLFLAVIIIELGFLFQVFVVFDKTKFLAAVLPGVMTTLTNEIRAKNGAPILKENPLLVKAAELKAADMAARGYFAHVSPDGKTPWSWLKEAGYSYSSAGENLAVNFSESEDVAQAWMDSPSHRANILQENFTEIGIGVARGTYKGRSTIFVAQFFGKPQAALAAQAPAPTPITSPAPAPSPSPIQVAVNPTPTPTEVLGEEEVVPVKTSPSPSSIKTSAKTSIREALTSPRHTVAYVYGAIALLVILSLLLVFFIRLEMHHPKFMAKGLMLFSAIVFLLLINLKVLSPGVQVPEDANDLSANVIEAINQ